MHGFAAEKSQGLLPDLIILGSDYIRFPNPT